MADIGSVHSAGTIVAAFLENSGYLLQARLLADFQDFFRDAGALIYLLAGAGAVISVTMYGSFRAVRYLLVGPALFWFLVGPTVESEGVLPKLGKGDYLGKLRNKGEAESKAFRKEVMDKAMQGDSSQINVAVGFYLFAWPINDFVSEFASRMLYKGDTEDLTATNKVRGLELVAEATSNDSEHARRLSSFATHCGKMFAEGVQAGAALASIRANQKANRTNPGANTELQKTYDAHLKQVELLYGSFADGFSVRNTGFEELLKIMKEIDDPDTTITCGEAWELLSSETLLHAQKATPWVINVASGLWEFDDAQDWTCKELTRKVLNEEENDGECKLYPAIAMAMLHNQLLSMDFFGQVLKRHWAQGDPHNPKRSTLITAPASQGALPVELEGQVQSQIRMNNQGKIQNEILTVKQGPGQNDVATYQYVPMAKISQLWGMDHSMFVATRKFELARLRQELFTFSMHMPYYQGMLLYLIAGTYPFFALIVLIPGRAHNFINIPIAWLWVKSWDIGFAAIIILDKVMYNMLPDWKLAKELQDQDWNSPEEFVLAMSEGVDFDPLTSLHMYYAVLATVTLGIPALTGIITLKSRRSALAAFTDAPAKLARTRGDQRATAYSLVEQNRRNRFMLQLDGFSQLASVGGVGGVGGGSKGISANVIQMGRAVAENAKAQNLSDLGNGQAARAALQVPEKMLKADAKAWAAKADIELAEARMERSATQRFHHLIGRYSVPTAGQEAATSAMDDGLGFELSRHNNFAIGAILSLMSKKAELASNNYHDLLTWAAKQTGNAAADQILKGSLNKSSNNYFNTMLLGSAPFVMAVRQGLWNPAEGKKLSLKALKDMAGAEAYTDQEFLARVFHIDRFILKDRRIKAMFDQARGGIAGELFEDIFSALDKPAPGGISYSAELWVSAGGGDRFLAAPPSQVTGDIATSDQLSVRLNAVALSASALNAVTSDMRRRYEETSEAIGVFRREEYNKRVLDDEYMKRRYPGGDGVYAINKDRLKDSIIGYLGGAEGVQKLWNGYNDGAGLAYNGEAARHLTRAEAANISDRELAALMMAKEQQYTARKIAEADQMYQSGEIDANSRLSWGAQLQHGQLPMNLLMLAQNNPLVAMEFIDEWLGRLRGGTYQSQISGVGASLNDVALTPADYLKG